MTSTRGRRAYLGLYLLSATIAACSDAPPTGALSQDEQHDPTHDDHLPWPGPGDRFPENTVVAPRAPISLPGGGGVTDTGAASYTLPLQIPDGPNGAQPRLSLEYTGTPVNGPLGVGMTLGGLSVIVPCSKTFAAEGRAEAPSFDADDSYCMDGVKLVPIEDPDYVHAGGGDYTIFHTELETFQRIVARFDDDLVDQPTSFVVYDGNGNVRTYLPRWAGQFTGVSAREVVLETDRKDYVAYAYLLADVVDADGNRIEYHYEDKDSTDDGEVSNRLATIEYSFADGVVPKRRIELRYGNRPDPIVAFHRGVKIVSRSRLTSIEMWAPNPTVTGRVWRYLLRYERSADTGRSLLRHVTLCEQHDECSWTRSFAWTEVAGTDLADDFEDHEISNEVEFDGEALGADAEAWDEIYEAREAEQLDDDGDDGPAWIAGRDTRLLLFDVDGDGDDDALYRTAPSGVGLNRSEVCSATECSLVRRKYRSVLGRLALRLSTRDVVGAPAYQPLAGLHIVTALLESPFASGEDETHDALDIVGEWASYVNLGKSRVADFDFDGDLELQIARTKVVVTDGELDPAQLAIDTWGYGYNTLSYPWSVSEWLDDIALYGPVLYPKDVVNLTLSNEHENRIASPPFQRILADVDGDGRIEAIDSVSNVDLTTVADVQWHVPFELQDGTFPYSATTSSGPHAVEWNLGWQCNNGQARVVDADGDGREDVFVTDEHLQDVVAGPDSFWGVYRRLSFDDSTTDQPVGDTMVGSTSLLWGGDCGANDPDLTMGDWNGDGLIDALYPPGSYDDNTEPLVRWNLGNGFGPREVFPVGGANAGTLTTLLRQDAPKDLDGGPIAWDRGTRAADLNDDGRTDLVAFRQDNTACIEAPIQQVETGNLDVDFTCAVTVVAYFSHGDHFEGQVLHTWDDAGASLSDGFTMAQVGDVNGDGSEDLVHVVNGRLHAVFLPWRRTPDRLATVEDDGFSAPMEQFTYTRQWWGDAPEPAAQHDCAYPRSCSNRGFEVVRSHRVHSGTYKDGNERWRTLIHRYEGHKSDLRGRGALGFAVHKIWDRELGVETIRFFDNTTRVDATPGIAGGEFYPYAGSPQTEITVTPILPLPSLAALDTAIAAPGLASGEPVPARITSATTALELRTSGPDGRILTSLTSDTWSFTVDHHANPLLLNGAVLSATPTYDLTSLLFVPDDADRIDRHSTTEHDAFGNVTRELSQTTGGVTTIVDTVHDTSAARRAAWQIRLATRSKTRSHDADDASHPAHIVRAAYDPQGRVKTVWAKAMPHATCALATELACELESTETNYGYDERGNVITTTVTAVDDPTPRTMTIGFDDEGVHAFSATDALGVSGTALLHPALGVVVQTTDEIGVVASMQYDGFGRLVSETHPGYGGVSYAYAEYTEPAGAGTRRGLRVDSFASTGAASYIRSNERGRQVDGGTLGPDGVWNVAWTDYDVTGGVRVVSIPQKYTLSGLVTRHERDRLRRTTATIAPDAAITTYEHEMFETTTIDPEGHETFTHSDADGRVVRSAHRLTDLDGPFPYQDLEYGIVENRYGPFDQLEQVTDALGNVTTYVYDAFGRSVRSLDPDAGESTFEINGFGEITSATRGGIGTTTEYDALGRAVVRTGPDGVETLEYGTAGPALHRLVRATSTDGVVTELDYDDFGRTHELRQTVDGKTDRFDVRYDTDGRVRHVFYPEVPGFKRFTTMTHYDSTGHLVGIGDASTCTLSTEEEPPLPQPVCDAPPLWRVVERDARSQVTKERFGPTGLFLTTRNIDAATGRLTGIDVGPGAAVTQSFRYEYLSDGLPWRRRDLVAHRDEIFAHDDLHRLTEWQIRIDHGEGPNGEPLEDFDSSTTYTYDPLGNLLSVVRDGTTTFSGTYGQLGGPHQLDTNLTVGGIFVPGSRSFGYDERGRQIDQGDGTIVWTQGDQPRRIERDSGSFAFVYDASNSRARKTSDTETVTYVGRLFERHEGVDGTTRNVFLVPGDGTVVAQMTYVQAPSGDAKEPRYLVGDGLGSTVLLLDDDEVLAKTYYAPFGARVDEEGEEFGDPDQTSSVGFTSHEDDGDGLINMQGRVYDLTQYRFLSPDPVVVDPLFGQTWNPYSYVFNSPLAHVDPTGFSAVVVAPPPAPEPPPPTDPTPPTEVTELAPMGVDDATAPPQAPPPPASTTTMVGYPTMEEVAEAMRKSRLSNDEWMDENGFEFDEDTLQGLDDMYNSWPFAATGPNQYMTPQAWQDERRKTPPWLAHLAMLGAEIAVGTICAPLGMAMSGYGFYQAWKAGDTEGMIINGIGMIPGGKLAKLAKLGKLAGKGGKGVIYLLKGTRRVKGKRIKNTPTGLDYIGKANDMEWRALTATDFRNRWGAKIVDFFDVKKPRQARIREQQAINDHGGVDMLDNRRNEISEKDWSKYGIDPPE
jgi:RHS repeat-associated protein